MASCSCTHADPSWTAICFSQGGGDLCVLITGLPVFFSRKSKRRRAIPARRPPSCQRLISERETERGGRDSGTQTLASRFHLAVTASTYISMEELLEEAAGRFVTSKAVPMPTGPYLRTWLVYSGETSPLSRCRLDSGPLSLLGLGASIGRG